MSHHTVAINPAHVSPTTINSWDIDGGLAADFDGSLSGLGTELGTSSYNMSEALLALPVFKQEALDTGFQYILCAATSPAIKKSEETLTYLNQGQSYEIKVKKLGDLAEYQGKCLRSVIKVCFHERRLQFMEQEQIEFWKMNRPGERIIDLDVPLSYGLVDINVDPNKLNQVEILWDPTKETGVYIKVHCISTEFTAKKHGGEKGVPFRIQIESYTQEGGDDFNIVHCASCQVKVFKPKGADRKHKTDREKMEKRPSTEKEKYQPSYDCTVLIEVPLDQVIQSPTANPSPILKSPGSYRVQQTYREPCSPASIPSTPSPAPKRPSEDVESSDNFTGEPLSPDATVTEVTKWLQCNRFSQYVRVFQNFSGADVLRLTRDDLIQICGLADGIRLNNAIQSRSVRPRLTMFVCQEGDAIYNAIYLENMSYQELRGKLAILYSVQPQYIENIYFQGPSGIHILVTDEVIRNLQDQTRFCVEAMREMEHYKVILKAVD
ncbi:hypothetical protein ScPMuIL_012253 [Solemya velum]